MPRVPTQWEEPYIDQEECINCGNCWDNEYLNCPHGTKLEPDGLSTKFSDDCVGIGNCSNNEGKYPEDWRCKLLEQLNDNECPVLAGMAPWME